MKKFNLVAFVNEVPVAVLYTNGYNGENIINGWIKDMTNSDYIFSKGLFIKTNKNSNFKIRKSGTAIEVFEENIILKIEEIQEKQ